ncbi:hypothetical protein CONCODRAFT_20312 [Conidiobolus coronatus NRRL 28638]|uniref:Xylanolytic transcriptional activator regulatory domain-containing protein n=1 Tax=Conidiobolus coronatus (strain ATCC 28846 / CBS 209.66 / NRRL 28638) TaxID=796925 RepID=A0A137NU10_CONC2|nr:hypothetical protein CONCODRAFT_20312 [Conidiobolus coronatus NRRL 28638]|eukprot:KXN66283.1 hypothetical protein CONCODRAFT_20312 [Conidiobolus coronatus NRRL 28638]
MNHNIQLSSVVDYRPCIKCNKGLSKTGDIYCKDCKPKREYNRTLNKSQSKAYLRKFEVNSSSYGKEVVKGYKETTFVYLKYNLNKELSIQMNTISKNLFMLYLDQFSDFDGFSSFIANSGQVSSVYFLFISSTIQQKPKYQQFIKLKQDKLPHALTTIQATITIPISRPLQLLKQKSYWDGLINLYFKYFHPSAPIFSVHSFNPKTAGKCILSAIYYAGFQLTQDKPLELVKYFNEYAEHNIKEATKSISLQNAQATFIYSFSMLISGNIKLFKACQAHVIRMCYALGIHLNLKRLTPIQQYDRFQFFSTTSAIHIGFYGLDYLTLNQLTELGDIDIELLKPEYQIPNSKCAFYFDTEDENIVYGVCAYTHILLYHIQAQNLSNLGKCNNQSIQAEFDILFNKATQRYYESMFTIEFLLKEFPHLESNILVYKFKLRIVHRILNLKMYRILRYKVKKLSPRQTSEMFNDCVILFDSIIESQEITQISHTYPYTAGLNFISIYPIVNASEKALIKQKLYELLDYFSKGPIHDKLSYLIIKKEYESILK